MGHVVNNDDAGSWQDRVWDDRGSEWAFCCSFPAPPNCLGPLLLLSLSPGTGVAGLLVAVHGTLRPQDCESTVCSGSCCYVVRPARTKPANLWGCGRNLIILASEQCGELNGVKEG